MWNRYSWRLSLSDDFFQVVVNVESETDRGIANGGCSLNLVDGKSTPVQIEGTAMEIAVNSKKNQTTGCSELYCGI